MDPLALLEAKLSSSRDSAAISRVADEAMRSLMAATGSTRFIEGRVVSADEAEVHAEALRGFLLEALERLAARSSAAAASFATRYAKHEEHTGLVLVGRFEPARDAAAQIPDDLANAVEALRTIARVVCGGAAPAHELAAAEEDLGVRLPPDLVRFATTIGSLAASVDGQSMPILEVLAVEEWEALESEDGLPPRLGVVRLGTEGNPEQLGCHADSDGALVWSNVLGNTRRASMADLLQYGVGIAHRVRDAGEFPELPWDAFFEAT
ncbi:MAG: hypothetical protein JWP87_5860 [Labilithrix sp.]|nr:hypothetical protein [Labilithrix sp.]